MMEKKKYVNVKIVIAYRASDTEQRQTIIFIQIPVLIVFYLIILNSLFYSYKLNIRNFNFGIITRSAKELKF